MTTCHWANSVKTLKDKFYLCTYAICTTFHEQEPNTATTVSPFKVLEFGTVCRLNCEFQTLLLKHSEMDWRSFCSTCNRELLVHLRHWLIANLRSINVLNNNSNNFTLNDWFRSCAVHLCSTFFLMGPCNQLKRMFAETRLIASIVVLVSAVTFRSRLAN